MKISIIIPVYNEENSIEKLLKTLEPMKSRCEILFVDGGSRDKTLERIPWEYTVLTSEKGRANQMNLGAKASTGELLFFLHCDSELPKTALEEMEHVLETHRYGCFGIGFDCDSLLMKCCAYLSNARAKLRGIPFGDQGIFMTRELFFLAGMYPAIPIMEDYELALVLKKMNIKPGMTKSRIRTSHRRFEGSNLHKLKVMWQMNRLRARYRSNVAVEEIARSYADLR